MKKALAIFLLLGICGLASAARAEVLAPCNAAPTFTFLKTAPASANWSAGNFTYTVSLDITAINGTPGCTLNAVTVSDPLPALAQFVSATPPAGWTVTASPVVGTTGTVTFSHTGNISAPATSVFSIVITAPVAANGTTFSNTATVAGGNPVWTAPSTASTLITPVALQGFQAD